MKVWWKFHWNFQWACETFMKVSDETFTSCMKVSWNFHLHVKVSWKFRETFNCIWKFHESFMKLSYVVESFIWNFHESFICPLKVSVKVSPNFQQTFTCLLFEQQNSCKHTWKFHLFEPKNAFFLGKKAKPSALIPILSETYCFNWINIGIPRLPTGLKYVVVWLKIESSEGAKCT